MNIKKWLARADIGVALPTGKDRPGYVLDWSEALLRAVLAHVTRHPPFYAWHVCSALPHEHVPIDGTADKFS